MVYKILIISILSCVFFSFYTTQDKSEKTKLELGHYLFFEKKLSATDSKSCSSCHDPNFAFSDGYRKPLGIYADIIPHNTPTLLNATEYKSLNLANPKLHSFEEQMLIPLFGKHPIEMGNNPNDSSVFNKLVGNSFYKNLFSNAFPYEKNPLNWKNTIEAIALYVKNLKSKNALYDEVLAGKKQFSMSQKDGFKLFFSKKSKCYQCHSGTNFSNSKYYKSLLNDDDNGVYNITKKEKDKHFFRVPTLRNIALTSPYMHDGSVANLQDAIQVCQKYKKSKPLTPFEKINIINFLYTLTDSTIFTNPLFRDPFINN